MADVIRKGSDVNKRVFIGAAMVDTGRGTAELHATWGEDGLLWTLNGYPRSGKAEATELERRANRVTFDADYKYSTADGMPGFGLAADVCAHLGMQWKPAELEDDDEDEKGTARPNMVH
jgi:hypothetical protein